MKKIFFFSLLFIAISFASHGQQNIGSLPDGWHKFTVDGISFDVQIVNGFILRGNAVYPNGLKYSGSWSKNQFSGPGTLTWENGDYYEGKFSNGLRSGYGTMHWKNGNRYGGKWRRGVRSGKGRMWHADGKFVKGVWENDKLVTTTKSVDKKG